MANGDPWVTGFGRFDRWDCWPYALDYGRSYVSTTIQEVCHRCGHVCGNPTRYIDGLATCRWCLAELEKHGG